jgi:hypothetical protein|tara:strand:+ start:409 stop:948 length:540 start_codon:yes stop_codon:yes gene_type:complete
MSKRNGFVYKLTNNLNGKMYVGSTVRTPRLFKWYYGGGIVINQAIKRNGRSNFSKEALYYGPDYRELEEFILHELDAVNNPNYYNITNNARGGYNAAAYTKEARAKQAKAHSKTMKGRRLKHFEKPTIQMDLQGNVINTFYSLNEASRQTGVKPDNICAYIRQRPKRNHAGGFLWAYTT